MPPPRRSSKSVWRTASSQESWRAVGLSLAVHLGIALLLFAGLKWQLESPGPLQVELWTEGNTTEVARAPDEPEPQPEPDPQPEPQPAPQSEPQPSQQPAPPPEPPPAPPEPDIAAREAEIALEQAKERERAEKARLEAERLAREAAERKQREEQERIARLEAERKAKEEAARKAREEAARQARLEQERQEREQQAKLEAERQAKELAEQQARERAEQAAKEEAAKKAQAEQKAKEEAARKAEADRKAKEEAARKAEAERKAKEEAARKAEAERKAKAEAAAREKALRDAFRNDIMGATGIAGGTATRNQQGGGADAGYAGQIRACIQPNVSFPTPVRSGNDNPTAQFRVQLKSDGSVASTSLRRSSGNTAFDRAVDNGIRRCSPFPKPPSGRYPSYIDVNYQMYD
ncbi:MAG: cell envelope integrity protein TolA [Burkholderiaceae bacterium]|nr:cell envelope integrity protein TolA [Burkholderiaceae bacterium]MCD8537605.1 cell envelope integrity protein TolA [Burkholderiaceae bacterium]MCD8566003.1 cell envelope integrity protein TolA [Burkholderiaceae bacterium]